MVLAGYNGVMICTLNVNRANLIDCKGKSSLGVVRQDTPTFRKEDEEITLAR